jgi:hypothetical protein
MEGPDAECDNDEVVRRAAWQELREMAAEAQRMFGGQDVVVQPSIEIQPGVWHRPLAESESDVTIDRPRD